MAFQSIFPREGLATSTIAKIWLFTAMSFNMTLQVVLAVKGEWAQVAGELAIWQGRVVNVP
jgi:hypothetical protein